MSRRKKIALLLAVPAGLGVLALGGAAFHYTRPEVQRALALDALRDAGLSGDIGRIAIDLSGNFSAADIAVTDTSGRRFALAQAKGSLSVWGALFGDIHLGGLEVSGLTADFSNVKIAKAANEGPAGAPPAGNEPPRVRIDGAKFSGLVILTPRNTFTFNLRIPELDTRSGATLVFDISQKNGPAASGEARVKITDLPRPGEKIADLLRRVKPSVSLDADVRPKDGAPVAARLLLEGAENGATLVVKSGASRFTLKATPGNSGEIIFAGETALGRDALAPWIENAPDFTGGAKFTAAITPETGAVKASLTASASTDKSPFGEEGPKVFSLTTDFERANDSFRILKLHTEMGSAARPGALVADISGLTVRTKGGLRVETGSDNAADLKLSGLPAVWLNAALGDETTVTGGKLDGEIRLTRTPAGEVVADSGPGLRAEGVALHRTDAASVSGIGAMLPFQLALAPDGSLKASGTKAAVTLDGKMLAGGDFTWSGSDGSGALTLSTTFDPGVLPAGFLPGGVCEFCAQTGTTLTINARGDRSPKGEINVSSATVEAVTKDGVRALAVSLPRPLKLSNIPQDGKPVATFAFKGAPLGLFNPLLGGAVLAGIAEKGDLDLSRTIEGWRVARPAGGSEAVIKGLSWRDASGRDRLDPTDAHGVIAWESTAAGWKLSLGDIAFSNAAGTALAGGVVFDWESGPTRLDADLSGDFRALAASCPDFAGTGVVAGKFAVKAHRGHGEESTLDLRIRETKTSESGPVFSASLNGTAKESADATRFDAPFLFTGPSGTTHATLSGKYIASKSGRDWDVRLNGDTLEVADWIALFPGTPGKQATPKPAPASVSTTAPKADTKPAWAGETGNFSVAFDAIRLAGESFDKPKFAVTATPDAIRTTACETVWRGVSVNGIASVLFKAGVPDPYTLSAAGSAPKVPLGDIITSFSPKTKGMIDGDFDVTFYAGGEAPDLGSLPRNVSAGTDLKSSGGVLRFFMADNDAVRLSGDLAGMASDLAGDLGRIIGKKAPLAGRALSSISQLRTALGSIRYESLTLSVKRAPDGSLSMPAAEVLNDSLRLRATGKIGPGPVFAERHATFNATVEGKSTIGAALKALTTVSKPADADWTQGPALRFDGPLNDLRSNLFDGLFKSAPAAPQPGVTDGGNPATPGDPAKTSDDAVRTLEKALNGLGI